MRIEYALRKRDSLKNEIQSLADWTIRSKLSQAEYLARRSEIYSSDWVRKSPLWIRQWCEGYERAMVEAIERLTEFCYIVPLVADNMKKVAYLDGRPIIDTQKGLPFVLPIACDTYRMISPHTICTGHDAGWIGNGTFWKRKWDYSSPSLFDDSKVWFLSERDN